VRFCSQLLQKMCIFAPPYKSPKSSGTQNLIIMNKSINQKVTYSIGVRSDKNLNKDHHYLYLNLYINNERVGRKCLNIPVLKGKWDKQAQQILKPKGAEINYNQKIRSYKNDIEMVISEHMVNNIPIVWDTFLSEIFDLGSSKDFFKYFEKVASRKTPTTKKGYIKNMNYLKKYATTLNFAHVNNPKFFNDFIYFLTNEYKTDKVTGLAPSSINKCVSIIKSILTEAKNERIINDINISSVKRLSEPDKKKIFLTCEELRHLLNYYYSYQFGSDRKKDSFKAFLFCCFTGIRIGRVSDIKYSDIRNNCWNNFNEMKNSHHKRVDLIYDMAFKFIDKPTKENRDDKIFNMEVEQRARKTVKEVIKEFNKENDDIQLNEDITFHSSKKTCVNMVRRFANDSDYAKFKAGHILQGVTNEYYMKYANSEIEQETNRKINEYFMGIF